jgi:peptidoglycan/LPS O-acetylase OafA/YrhL
MLQQWHLIHMELSAWLAALLFAKNFVDDKTHFLSHFWSLSVEEQFYFFWPACFGFLSSTGQGWKLITTCSLSLFMLIAANLNKGFNGLASMGFGCTLALLFADPQLTKALTSVMSTRNWYLCVAIVLLGVFSKLPFAHWWLPPLMGLMVVGTVVRPMTLAGRILELKWLRWVGRCSYSIYLWQELFCVMGMPTHPFGILQTFPLNILCSFACAIPSFYFIEKPLIHLGHRFAPPATPGRSDLSK